MLREFLVVGAGGAVGSMVRYLLSGHLLAGYTLCGFPAGTFGVNVVGSLLIGIFTGWLGDSPWLLKLMTVGFCGGFTTFSTFSADTLKLLRNGDWLPATLYVGLSLIVCLVCVGIGLWLGENLKQ